MMTATADVYFKSEIKSKRVLKVVDRDNIYLLHCEDIYYLESSDNYTYIYTKDKKLLSCRTLKHHIEKLCPSMFIRVHHSYCVNKMQISSIKRAGYMLTTRSGKEIPISRSKKSLVLGAFE